LSYAPFNDWHTFAENAGQLRGRFWTKLFSPAYRTGVKRFPIIRTCRF